jgi:oligopeptide transport system ATP-binding protein
MNFDDQPLLEVRELRTEFVTEAGRLTAVDGVSLNVPRGATVALVGESGCGKSVTALSIMRLIPEPPGRIVSGRVLLQAREQEEHAHASVGMPPGPIDLLQLGAKRMRMIRGGRIAMIFQEPMTALNPVLTVGEQIIEAVELHQALRGKDARDHAVEMLRKVGIAAPDRRADDYPHQMSGGMLQRVMIAMALAGRPELLIADEPTTALDVTVQLQILELLRSLQAETGLSVLLITHDLGVVAEIADYVYVMYAGRIVEHAPTGDLLTSPLHPYTRGLLHCVPRLSQRKKRLEVIPGNIPDPVNPPPGCRFHPRCRLSAERANDVGRAAIEIESRAGRSVLRRCVEPYEDEPSGRPDLQELKPGHFVACWEAEVGSHTSEPAATR